MHVFEVTYLKSSIVTVLNLLFYIIMNKMKQQITENEENLFSEKIAQVTVVTLRGLINKGGLKWTDLKQITLKGSGASKKH